MPMVGVLMVMMMELVVAVLVVIIVVLMMVAFLFLLLLMMMMMGSLLERRVPIVGVPMGTAWLSSSQKGGELIGDTFGKCLNGGDEAVWMIDMKLICIVLEQHH